MGKTILGLDPGTYFLGAGCLAKERNKTKLVHVDVLTAPKNRTLKERLGILMEKMETLLDRFPPDEAAIEDIFYGKNARSAFHLGVARGVIIASCLRRKIPVFEYSPSQVKSVVTGQGRADKEQVKRMTELHLGQKISLRHDATDALAVAICHAYTLNLTEQHARISRRQNHFKTIR